MFRIVTIQLLLAILVGCRSHPMPVSMRGAMAVDGNVDMQGDMSMSGDLTTSIRPDNTASRLQQIVISGNAQGPNKIAVIGIDNLMVNRNLSGLGSMGENPVALFREKLNALALDPSVKALVLRIDTPGGGVNASDLMSHELEIFKASRNIPVVACIMSVGTGGGYYLASFADHIVAQPSSIVGGIGVILNTYNLEDTLGQFNVVSIPVKAGEKIDIASPQRTMEEGEREILQGIADAMHARFIAQVQRTRPGIGNGSPLFDGRVIIGLAAQKASLVDQIGYPDDAISAAMQMAKVTPDAAVVMLRRDNDRAYTVLDKTPNTPTTSSIIPLNIPGLDRSALPTFLYLWQADPRVVTASGA
jgi:protease-4